MQSGPMKSEPAGVAWTDKTVLFHGWSQSSTVSVVCLMGVRGEFLLASSVLTAEECEREEQEETGESERCLSEEEKEEDEGGGGSLGVFASGAGGCSGTACVSGWGSRDGSVVG